MIHLLRVYTLYIVSTAANTAQQRETLRFYRTSDISSVLFVTVSLLITRMYLLVYVIISFYSFTKKIYKLKCF
jgi:hypothetical protein